MAVATIGPRNDGFGSNADEVLHSRQFRSQVVCGHRPVKHTRLDLTPAV